MIKDSGPKIAAVGGEKNGGGGEKWGAKSEGGKDGGSEITKEEKFGARKTTMVGTA